jgi:hypothetical protein
MTAPLVFTQCGLHIRSSVDLHLPTSNDDHHDVDVQWCTDTVDTSAPPPGDLVAELDVPDGGWWYKATETVDGYVLRFHDCGEFRVSPSLDRVEVRATPGPNAPILPVLMAGTVSSFLLTLRGATILHASAVAVDGGALAFVGPSGRGKTTLAALLSRAGAALVTDDVLAVDPGPPTTCIGGASELRLREAAASLSIGGSTRMTEDDRIALSVACAPVAPVPLRAVVIPAPSRGIEDVEIRRLRSSTALIPFLAFPRVYGWRRDDVLSRDFAVFGALANEVPVYTAKVPWGPPFDPAVVDALMSLGRPTPAEEVSALGGDDG